MAKTQPPHNRADISKGPGDVAAEKGRERAMVEAEEEGRGGKQVDKAKDPPAEGRNKKRDMRPERTERRQRRKRTRMEKRRKGIGTERPH